MELVSAVTKSATDRTLDAVREPSSALGGIKIGVGVAQGKSKRVKTDAAKRPKGAAKAGTARPRRRLVKRELVDGFIDLVLERGLANYREFAWRDTSDSYATAISEIMLQQTQAPRVVGFFDRWMELFPTVDALTAAPLPLVLEQWQGLGYNRRALQVKRLAEVVSEELGGVLPTTYDELLALPGVGPSTAAGIVIFAFDQPALYYETNVRTVYLHEVWPKAEEVHDREVIEVARRVIDRIVERGISPRTWTYALLDYGNWLKKEFPNPSRRSKQYVKGAKFEGSRRQKRGALLAEVIGTPGLSLGEYAERTGYDVAVADDVLQSLAAEGFLACDEGGCWGVPE